MKIKFLLSSGDPTGIGPEICLKCLSDLPHIQNDNDSLFPLKDKIFKQEITLSLIGNGKIFSDLIQRYHLPLDFIETEKYAFLQHQKFPEIKVDFLNLVFPELENELSKEKKRDDLPPDLDSLYERLRMFGSGKFSLQLLHKAIGLLKLKQFHGLITAPINKKNIVKDLKKDNENLDSENISSEKKFMGHTEYLANSFGVTQYNMVFFSSFFDLVLLSTHIPLSQVEDYITREKIEEAIQRGLFIQKFTKDQTPILVMGVNPHAGEKGQIGKIDTLLEQVIKEQQKKGINIIGPCSADSAFVWVYQKKYRTVIAAYHDQGLIPLKMIAKGSSVNVTMGLPFIRTSVDHGTAYDIVGRNEADATSLIYAIEKARQLYQY